MRGTDGLAGRTELALTSLRNHATATFSTLLCSAMVVAASPAAHAQLPSVEQAVIDYAEAARPILRSLQPSEISAFSSKAAELALSAKPEVVVKAVDVALDAFLTIPSEKLTVTQDVLVAAYADVPLSSCDRVPLPPAEVRQRVAGATLGSADPSKVKAVASYATNALKVIPHDGGGFCLPPAPALGKVTLAASDAAAAADPVKVRAITEQGRLVLKSIPKASAVRTLPELTLRAKMFGELPDRQRLKAMRSVLVEAQAAEEARVKAAAFPDKCYTMSCYSYPNDLGAGRAMMEFDPELALYEPPDTKVAAARR